MDERKGELPGQEIEMEHEPTLLYALKKLLERSGSEYWPVEQEIAWWAIEIAEKEEARKATQQHPKST